MIEHSMVWMGLRRLRRKIALVAASKVMLFSASAYAVPTLTPSAITAGFSLSQFADEFPTTGFCCGPLGIAFPTTGGVMVSDYPGNVRVFATDTDGQHAPAAPIGQ